MSDQRRVFVPRVTLASRMFLGCREAPLLPEHSDASYSEMLLSVREIYPET